MFVTFITNHHHQVVIQKQLHYMSRQQPEASIQKQELKHKTYFECQNDGLEGTTDCSF